MTERWRISVDHGLCIGSAVCVGTLPTHFQLDGSRSVPVHEEVEPNDEVIGAAESCPMEAIRVIRVDTGEVLAPQD